MKYKRRKGRQINTYKHHTEKKIIQKTAQVIKKKKEIRKTSDTRLHKQTSECRDAPQRQAATKRTEKGASNTSNLLSSSTVSRTGRLDRGTARSADKRKL